MKIELELSDIQAIAQQVIKAIKPILAKNKPEDDTLFDVEGLAKYLIVDLPWIYQNQKSLPRFKVGRFVRYRKKEIDKWLESQRIPATQDRLNRPPPLKLMK